MPARREQYVAWRVGTRMQERGEPMVLRRISMSDGPQPYPNPPDVASDVTVATGVSVTGQVYFGLVGTAINGRLIAGDQLVCSAAPGSMALTTWTVMAMPNTIATDADGVPIVGSDGTPHVAAPTKYTADSLAAANRFPCVPVTPVSGTPDPAASIGDSVSFIYQADQALYGTTLSFNEMALAGWTEVDSVGLRLAAYTNAPVAPPKINDQIILAGQLRSIVAVLPTFRSGVQLSYVVQAK